MLRGSVTASLIGYVLLMHVKEFGQLLIGISSLLEKISRGCITKEWSCHTTVQQSSPGTISRACGVIRDAELKAQKKHLVDTFYKEVNNAYGLRPDQFRVAYDQFRVDADGKTLYWTPGDKKNLDYYDEGRGPVPGVINTGLEVRGGWFRCTAEIAGTHW